MTDKKRIEILEEAKEILNTSDSAEFLCPLLSHLIDPLSPQYSNVFKVFPELKKHKPKHKHLDGSWWPAGDKETRIKVLNLIIKEIKAKQ